MNSFFSGFPCHSVRENEAFKVNIGKVANSEEAFAKAFQETETPLRKEDLGLQQEVQSVTQQLFPTSTAPISGVCMQVCEYRPIRSAVPWWCQNRISASCGQLSHVFEIHSPSPLQEAALDTPSLP